MGLETFMDDCMAAAMTNADLLTKTATFSAGTCAVIYDAAELAEIHHATGATITRMTTVLARNAVIGALYADAAALEGQLVTVEGRQYEVIHVREGPVNWTIQLKQADKAP